MSESVFVVALKEISFEGSVPSIPEGLRLRVVGYTDHHFGVQWDGTVRKIPKADVAASPIGTEARVCADIAKRQQHGLLKYGVSVEKNPLTLRQWMQHAYEEHLDAAIYLRRAIEEMDENDDAPPMQVLKNGL